MKKVIKKLVLITLYVLFGKSKHDGLRILTYHRITDKPDLDDPLKVSKSVFEKQIKYLTSHYTILSGDDLLNIIKLKKPFPNDACLITFDDGWKDNYTNAYPVLKKYNAPAIIFISTDFVGSNNIFWHEKLQELLKIPQYKSINNFDAALIKWPLEIRRNVQQILKHPVDKKQNLINELISTLKRYEPETINEFIVILSKTLRRTISEDALMLSWSEIKEMYNNKIVFGSHTKSHAILTQVPSKKILSEVNESKQIIEEMLDCDVYFISYPNGNYDENVLRLVESSGYLAGFTCISGLNESFLNSLELRRKHIREDSSLGLFNKFSELSFKIDLSDVKKHIKYHL